MEHCESVASLKKILSRMIVMVDLVRDLNLDFFLFFFIKKASGCWFYSFLFLSSMWSTLSLVLILDARHFSTFMGMGFNFQCSTGFFFGFF